MAPRQGPHKPIKSRPNPLDAAGITYEVPVAVVARVRPTLPTANDEAEKAVRW
ncbi:hypothetical protein ACWEFL_05530 [Streptomyces sp. NPDC004838]